MVNNNDRPPFCGRRVMARIAIIRRGDMSRRLRMTRRARPDDFCMIHFGCRLPRIGGMAGFATIGGIDMSGQRARVTPRARTGAQHLRVIHFQHGLPGQCRMAGITLIR